MVEIKSDAVKAAIKHFQFLMEDNHKDWLKTFVKRIQKQAKTGMRGHMAEFYWDAGRARVTKYGVTYVFARRIVFFRRIGKDGKQIGYKAKLIMKLVKGKWKVYIPSY